MDIALPVARERLFSSTAGRLSPTSKAQSFDLSGLPFSVSAMVMVTNAMVGELIVLLAFRLDDEEHNSCIEALYVS